MHQRYGIKNFIPRVSPVWNPLFEGNLYALYSNAQELNSTHRNSCSDCNIFRVHLVCERTSSSSRERRLGNAPYPSSTGDLASQIPRNKPTTVPWGEIWRITSLYCTPRDQITWLKLVHRNLYVANRDNTLLEPR